MPSSDVLSELRERIEQVQERWQPSRPQPVALGIPALDALVGQRLTLVELLAAADGGGATSLALFMARHACGEWKTLVVVDQDHTFYPFSLVRAGMPLDRLVVVRPRRRSDLLLATNQALRCPAIGAVVGWYEPLHTLDARRLQLAAETGGAIGFLLRPATASQSPSFAPLRLRVSPVPAPDSNRRFRVEILRCRGEKDGQSLCLEMDHETGVVRLLPAMAPPAALERTTTTAP